MAENKRKMLVIVNPMSGKMNIKSALFDVVQIFCQGGYIPTVITTSARGDATNIVANKSDEYDIVVCCGGDGTLNETITGMMRSDKRIPIGYIPCGSTNDMANTLRIPKSIKNAALTVISGHPYEHDIGKFGNNMYFTYIASFGVFTKASYSTPQSTKNLLGHFAYVLEGAKEIGEIRDYHVKFTFDGRCIEDDFAFVSVSNTISFAGLFSFPKDKVQLNDGKFEVLLIKRPKNLIETNSLLLSLSKRDYTHDSNIMLFHTNNIIVEPFEDVVWTIDGECSGKIGKVVIDNIPDTIRIIQPK